MGRYDFEGLTNEEQKQKMVGEFMNKMNEDYEIYQKQREERSNSRYEKEMIRNKRKKFIAVITAGMIALSGGVFAYKTLGDHPKEETSNNLTYDDYIKFVQEQRALGFEVTISEEGYKAFITQNSDETEEPEEYDQASEESNLTYDDYIKFVQEQRALGFEVTISEEGYKDFVQNYQIENKTSKGAR